MGRVGDSLAQLARTTRWYFASLMGDNHYQRYLALRRKTHPGEAEISEAEYWRLRHRDAERSPASHCC